MAWRPSKRSLGQIGFGWRRSSDWNVIGLEIRTALTLARAVQSSDVVRRALPKIIRDFSTCPTILSQNLPTKALLQR